jgi:hypothetical protein
MRIIVPVLFLILLSSSLEAKDIVAVSIAGKSTKETCTEIDLLKNSAPLKVWSKARRQYDLGWCVPFSVADVLTYKTRKAISAIHLGAIHFKENPQSNVYQDFIQLSHSGKKTAKDSSDYGDGAFPCEVFDNAKKLGACSVDHFEEANVNIDELKDFTEANLALSKQEADRIPSDQMKCTKNTSSLDMQVSILKRFSLHINTTSRREFLGYFANKTCGLETIKIDPNLTCDDYLSTEGGLLAGNVDLFLEQGTMPIFAFEAGSLYKTVKIPETAGHAVSINARRWNSEKRRCEYRIRDSQTRYHCGDYRENVSCSDNELKQGLVWVSGEFIDRTGNYISVIRETSF